MHKKYGIQTTTDNFNGTYKLILTTSADVAIWTVDNVEGSGSVNVTKLSSYADLVTAGSTIGTTESTLYIDKDDTMSANVIIPTTMQLHFLKGNIITTTGYTLTFSGSPENIIAQPNQQIFAGTGTVTFTKPGTVYPNWWATNTTPGTTDMNTARAASLVASKNGCLKLLNEIYKITAALVFDIDGSYHIKGATPRSA